MTDLDDSGLSAHQRQVAERVLAKEGAQRHHLVVSLSGAHAYGFPSPDSDLDLKAVHAESASRLLALDPPPPHASRFEVIDGVEVDYSSNELQPVLAGLIGGNGNYFERFLGAIPFSASPEIEELQALARGALSRRIHRHYAGFARAQLHEWEKSKLRSAKKLLYVLRTALTGTHVLRTGDFETNVTRLLDEYGFAEARVLVEAKRRGEHSELPSDLAEVWKTRIAKAFDALEAALGASSLPEDARNVADMEAWLLSFRRRQLAVGE